MDMADDVGALLAATEGRIRRVAVAEARRNTDSSREDGDGDVELGMRKGMLE